MKRSLPISMALGLVIWAAQAEALPRMSLTAGSPCATCHVSPQGGGMRNALGFTSMNKVGALTFGDMGLHSVHEAESAELFSHFSVGADVRYQTVRLGVPTPGPGGPDDPVVPDYETVQMQVQPYLAVTPTDWLSIYGSYNAGEDFSKGCENTYNGQPCWEAGVVLSPDTSLPGLRAGLIQPSIGIRQDDHTLFIRGGSRNPVIPPNYVEAGAEAFYQPVSWIRVEAGAFDNSKLNEALNPGVETEELGSMSYSARVSWMPQFRLGGQSFDEPDKGGDDFDDFDDFDEGPKEPPFSMNVNGWLGASVYGAGDFRMDNAFVGVGTDLGGAIQFEVSRTQTTSDVETFNRSLMLSWALKDWLVLNGRIERADVRIGTPLGEQERTADQYVAGIEFFPIPFVELRPEYRLIETDDFRFGQSTIQVHIFY